MASTNEIYDYKVNFNPSKGEALLKGYEALKPYGWYFESEEEGKCAAFLGCLPTTWQVPHSGACRYLEKEEKKVLDGTHELYQKQTESKNENG